MARDIHKELGETPPRLLTHWIAACFGHFLKLLLPLVAGWPAETVEFPRWWSVLLFAGSTSIVAALINANLPVTPRELLKSVSLGVALATTSQILGFV